MDRSCGTMRENRNIYRVLVRKLSGQMFGSSNQGQWNGQGMWLYEGEQKYLQSFGEETFWPDVRVIKSRTVEWTGNVAL